jgi:hypothetical protein
MFEQGSIDCSNYNIHTHTKVERKGGRKKDHLAVVLVVSVLIKSGIANIKTRSRITLALEEHCLQGCNAV